MAPVRQFTKDDLIVERLKGESTGRMLGRLSERRRIVAWLRAKRVENLAQLALSIDNGEHESEDLLYPEEE